MRGLLLHGVNAIARQIQGDLFDLCAIGHNLGQAVASWRYRLTSRWRASTWIKRQIPLTSSLMHTGRRFGSDSRTQPRSCLLSGVKLKKTSSIAVGYTKTREAPAVR